MSVLCFTPGTTDTVWLGGREADPALENDIWVWDTSEASVDRALWYRGQPDDGGGGQDYILSV